MEPLTELTSLQLGRLYDSMDPDVRAFTDCVIKFGNQKITTIKFLRSHLNLSLTLAKILFEARKEFLDHPDHPFGWR